MVSKPKKPPSKKQPKTPKPAAEPPKPQDNDNDDDTLPLDLSPLPLRLQQLLLDTFKRALLPSAPNTPGSEGEILDLAPLIQRLKTHLYNRDFASAFTDAGEDVLRAYALRWSAGRALGYAGVFRGVFAVLPRVDNGSGSSGSGGWHRRRIVCVGGGGGAEIGALAAVWRELAGSGSGSGSRPEGQSEAEAEAGPEPGLSVVAVDVADWAGVVRRLDASIHGADVAASASASAALVHAGHAETGTQGGFRVGFRRADVLDLSDGEMGAIFGAEAGDEPEPAQEAEEEESTALVTLMFTLNELFSTSMAKATGFLLRMTDSLQPGAVLLVVDSPGSYSTLRLGKGGEQERRYPMKFLLDHTLLSVARGKWERVFAQESRWWRRDATRLRYDVGPGAGLEDMRFQIHVYRRVRG